LKTPGDVQVKSVTPLGYKRLMNTPQEFAGCLVVGWSDEGKTDFYIGEGLRNTYRLHLAFRAHSREAVDASYSVALAAGGKDNGKPGLRTEYHSTYYGAFVLDPRWSQH